MYRNRHRLILTVLTVWLFSLIAIPASADVRFIQITDTHIIAGGTCSPFWSADGRTDCQVLLQDHVANWEDWVDPETGSSSAPTQALTEAVAVVNGMHAVEPIDFVVFTGDQIANQEGDETTGASYALFKSIADGLDMPYYVIGAALHDGLADPVCYTYYTDTFGEEMVNWWFLQEDNLFVGLSELALSETGDKFDLDFLRSVLDDHLQQGLKLFVFFHTPVLAWDEIESTHFRAEQDVIINTLRSYSSGYRVVVAVNGHNHANTVTRYYSGEGLYQLSTTALMNYPTAFRIGHLTSGTVSLTTSDSVSEAIDGISLEIVSANGDVDPLTLYGLESDRTLELTLDEVLNTVNCSLTCLPSSGTMPFSSALTVTLTNNTSYRRRVSSRLDVEFPGGALLAGWKHWTHILRPGGEKTFSFNKSFPINPKNCGTTTYTLNSEDVTLYPYNQPPNPPSGDTATSICTVEGIMP